MQLDEGEYYLVGSGQYDVYKGGAIIGQFDPAVDGGISAPTMGKTQLYVPETLSHTALIVDVENVDIVPSDPTVAVAYERRAKADVFLHNGRLARHQSHYQDSRFYGAALWQFVSVGEANSISWHNHLDNVTFSDTDYGATSNYDPNQGGFKAYFEGGKEQYPINKPNYSYFGYRWPANAGFFNTHTFDKCQFKVGGRPFDINHATRTIMDNCYLDIVHAPILREQASGLHIDTCAFDRNGKAKSLGEPVLYLENPRFAQLIVQGEDYGWKDNGSQTTHNVVADKDNVYTDLYTLNDDNWNNEYKVT